VIFLNSVASKDGAELLISIRDGNATISITYPLGVRCEFDLLAPEMYSDDEETNEIIDLFF